MPSRHHSRSSSRSWGESMALRSLRPLPSSMRISMRLLSISSALRCATSDTLRPAPYLLRYTHRVAISNSRLLRFDQTGVTFRHKDYRRAGADRQQVMTLAADQFIRRFLLHFLPKGFHRIRHYGLLAGVTRKAHLNQVRQMLGAAPSADADALIDPPDVRSPCPCCGGHMVVIETFERWCRPRAPPRGVTPTRTTTP